MHLKRLLVVNLLLIATLVCPAQDKTSYKFEKLTPGDFSRTRYDNHKDADAIILADVGTSKFVGNKKGWFSLVFKRRKRVLILKNTAADLATERIVLYKSNDDEEKLADLKASTYNEVNGAIIETELDKKDIFSEKLNKQHLEKKFTLPAVKEGSIIDVSYTIESDFIFNLQPWTFQQVAYPCLWSEYEVNVPSLLNYVFLKQGFNKFYIDKQDQKAEAYTVTMPADDVNLGAKPTDYFVNATNTRHRWVMKDLPALSNVEFLSTPINFVDKIEFQLSEISDGQDSKDVMDTWPKVIDELLKREDFGEALAENNFFLDKDVKEAIGTKSGSLEIARSICDYVRRNYISSGEGIFIRSKLADVARNHKGNAGEINLILIAMLRKAGFRANPVLVSTRGNGIPHENYPMISKYNYAFCNVLINGNMYFLDASRPLLGFGRLDPECYNGYARIISNEFKPIHLSRDSLKDVKAIVATAMHENNSMKVTIIKTPGYYESYQMRSTVARKGREGLLAELEKQLPSNATGAKFDFESLEKLDDKIAVRYEFDMAGATEDVFYLNPFMGNEYVKNLFKSEERVLPVEMDFPANTTYVLNMPIPDGYKVEEMPKSIRIKLNEEGDGMFEYMIQKDENFVSLRAKLIITRTLFDAEEYKMLREFFNVIIKKQNETIVFRKAGS